MRKVEATLELNNFSQGNCFPVYRNNPCFSLFITSRYHSNSHLVSGVAHFGEVAIHPRLVRRHVGFQRGQGLGVALG